MGYRTERGREVKRSRVELEDDKIKGFVEELYPEETNGEYATLKTTKCASGSRVGRSDPMDVSNVGVVNTDEKNDEESEEPNADNTILDAFRKAGGQGRQGHR